VRAASSLPESKELINKYVAKPAAWKAGFALTAEYLRNPPPQPVYGEVLKVLTSDRVASKSTTDLMMPIINNMPAMALQSSVSDQDMKLIGGVFSDATGGAPEMKTALVDSSASNAYWGGYRQGYADGIKGKRK
jgi:hypothetical protein